MNEIRITLISDATAEYPDNTNTDFKVRLAEPVRLPTEQQWQAAMVSLSTPNRPVAFVNDLGLKDQDTLIVFGMRILNDKFPKSDPKHIFDLTQETVSVTGVFGGEKPDNLTGVEFWSRIAMSLTHAQTGEMLRQARRTSHAVKTFDDEMVVMDVDSIGQTAKLRATNSNYSPSEFGLNLTVAKYFELVREAYPGVYTLGRNASWEGFRSYAGGRPIHEVRDIYENGISSNTLISVKKWGPFGEPIVYFSRFVNWWFTGLNRAADTTSTSSAGDKTSITRLAMVYCDIVQSSLVGNQKHQLLRELTLKDSGGSRRSVEPLHYQWLGVRNNVVEVVHVQLADENGKFLTLPEGKTMLTVTLKRA